MRISGILENSFVNGEGMRTVIFTQGCSHHCIECHNQSTWDFDKGMEVNTDYLIERIKYNMPLINGVTISGGDPLDQPEETLKLLKKIKSELKLNVWLYTGYVIEELNNKQKECLKYIDTIVDGPFKKDLTDNALKYTGSSNQRIINLKGENDLER